MKPKEKEYLINILDKRISSLENDGDSPYPIDKMSRDKELELAMSIRAKLND